MNQVKKPFRLNSSSKSPTFETNGFGTIRESTNSMKPMWRTHDREHQLLLWVSVAVLVGMASLARAAIRRGADTRKNQDSYEMR
jgi:hypothetical protein